MKRAGRVVYRLLSGLSLLLLLATFGVWVRSYWVSDMLTWDHRPRAQSFLDHGVIAYARGGIQFNALRYPVDNSSPRDDMHLQQGRGPATDYLAFGDDWSQYFPSKPPRYAALGFEW